MSDYPSNESATHRLIAHIKERISENVTIFNQRYPASRTKAWAHIKTHKWAYAAMWVLYAFFMHHYHFGLNLTNSLPFTFYLAKRDAAYTKDDYVTYLYQGFYTDNKPRTFVKQVAGVSGDTVKVYDDKAALAAKLEYIPVFINMVLINDIFVAGAKFKSYGGRPMQPLKPGVIPAGFVYLNANHKDSFDSRYLDIGLVPHEKITGRIIWMW
jgi:conjugal transfer pilin signal peptidase TrbI